MPDIFTGRWCQLVVCCCGLHADLHFTIILCQHRHELWTYNVLVCLTSFLFPGDGESIKDPSEEKPESEAEGVEEPVVEEGESVDSKEDAQKSDAEEHVEL